MEHQILLAASITAGVVFGFLIAWFSLRSDRNNIYARGRAEAEGDRAALEERVKAKDVRVQEIQTELSQEKEQSHRLRDENASLKASQQEVETRIAEARREAGERIAVTEEGHRRLIEMIEARTLGLGSELEKLRADNDFLRSENVRLQASQADVDARLQEARRLSDEKLALVSDAQSKLSETFRALSSEVLHNNNQAFLDLAKQTFERLQDGARSDLDSRQKSIDEMIRPLKESLSRVDSAIGDMEKTRTAAYATLGEQVSSLVQSQTQLRNETASLIHALRAPAVKGRWGELQLRRVVELAGMVEHCDFEQQPSVSTDDGVQRPDLIIHLPNSRKVVVDAKVSLKAYLESLDCPDESERSAKVIEHSAQVRAHLTRLGSKKYWSQFPEAPEFAVAFLPGETFFSAALQHDPGLIEFGAEQRVILATPTTLIALLKAVAYGWQQQRLAENAKNVSLLGQGLYERLRIFTGYLDDLRRNLVRTVDCYNKAAGSLETRVLVSARRFKEFGAAGGDDLPVIEQVDNVPRSLVALEQAALFPDTEPVSVEAIEDLRVASPPRSEISIAAGTTVVIED